MTNNVSRMLTSVNKFLHFLSLIMHRSLRHINPPQDVQMEVVKGHWFVAYFTLGHLACFRLSAHKLVL